MSESSVCVSTSDFKKYMYILLILIFYILYILYSSGKEHLTNIDLNSGMTTDQLKNKIIKLQEQLYDIQINEQKCQADLYKTTVLLKNNQINENTQNINKITNPLVSPERIYTNPLSNINSYQMVGFVYKDNDRYQLFGRYREPGRSDKWDYYIIDQNRQSLKIPVNTKNYSEIFDGDVLNIPTVGENFIAKIYELEQLRYNPNI